MDAPLSVHWTRVAGPTSGVLLASSALSATYRNPNKGGVYRFRVAIRNGAGTDVAFAEANLVLPLAGAEMDSVMQTNLPMADAFVARVVSKYTARERRNGNNLDRWFVEWNSGDYVGRLDNQATLSV